MVWCGKAPWREVWSCGASLVSWTQVIRVFAANLLSVAQTLRCRLAFGDELTVAYGESELAL